MGTSATNQSRTVFRAGEVFLRPHAAEWLLELLLRCAREGSVEIDYLDDGGVRIEATTDHLAAPIGAIDVAGDETPRDAAGKTNDASG